MLQRDPTTRTRTRIQRTLDGLQMPFRSFPDESLRTMRAVQALEQMDSEKARMVISHVENESVSPLERAEAQAALERLDARKSP